MRIQEKKIQFRIMQQKLMISQQIIKIYDQSYCTMNNLIITVYPINEQFLSKIKDIIIDILKSTSMEDANKLICELLETCNQKHILEAYKSASEENKKALAEQIAHLDKNYPGGIKNYYERSKQLVIDSANSVNPYADFDVSIPEGVVLRYTPDNLANISHYENLGMKEFEHTCFVLVAGGLGERLGYPGIKVAIPFDLLANKTFLSYYIEYILAFQKKFCKEGTKIPLLIMTSGDTHEKTVELLEHNKYFNMEKDQIIIVKQQKVPAITNNQAHFSLVNTDGKLSIETKPHGHGDIHTLLFMNGVVDKWHKQGKKWIIFFQDTNPLAFRCFSALLGVTAQKKFEFNSVTVSRKPGEAVGAITSLVNKQTKKNLTINVEYNQLKSLFKEGGGQQVDTHGYSKYPGNINSFVIDVARYHETLTKTKGVISEFINPKYADETKTKFKSSARLECLMQDYPKLLEDCSRVGYTSIDKGFCFTTLKNDPKTAIGKYKDGLSPESAGSCEAEFYHFNAEMLRLCGAHVEKGPKSQFGGIQIPLFPMISISPKFATSLTEMKSKVKDVKISGHSSLIIGDDCILQKIDLDGHAEIKGTDGKPVTIVNHEKNYKKVVDVTDPKAEPYLFIRGYKIQ